MFKSNKYTDTNLLKSTLICNTTHLAFKTKMIQINQVVTVHCCCSVTQLCPTLCDPMDCSTPGLSVHHQLPEFTQTHVHWVGDAIQPSHPLLSPSLSAFNLSQHQGLFKWVSSLHSGGQSTRVSVSASVFPMNIQDWFPLEWIGWISLLSKGLSRVFSNTIVQKHQFFSAQLYSPTLISIHDYWKNQSFE